MFDKLETPKEDKFEFEKHQKYLFLCYYCFADGSFGGNETGVFFDYYNAFFEGGISMERFELLEEFFDLVLQNNQQNIDELIDYCLEGVDNKDYKKIFIYLIEGVFCDGKVNEQEKSKVKYLAKKMNIENELSEKIIDVAILKYM
ncbi:MAG: hypothetical protein R2812_00010 [Gelidibacter sp.]